MTAPLRARSASRSRNHEAVAITAAITIGMPPTRRTLDAMRRAAISLYSHDNAGPYQREGDRRSVPRLSFYLYGNLDRHCERSEATQGVGLRLISSIEFDARLLGRRVASLLAMTALGAGVLRRAQLLGVDVDDQGREQD